MNEAVAIKKKLRLQSTKIDACDLFAVIAGLALTLYFLLTAKLSVGLPDETTYLSIPMRILQGDRFFIDEWNLPQLSSLCSFLPFKIFVALTGSTDGCVAQPRSRGDRTLGIGSMVQKLDLHRKPLS